MAGICDTIIAKGIELNCDNPLVMGMESNGLIINRSQIDFAQTVFDTDNKNIIKTLVLKTGAKAYPVVQQGATPFTGAKTSLVVGTYFNSFTNEIPLLVLDNGRRGSKCRGQAGKRLICAHSEERAQGRCW